MMTKLEEDVIRTCLSYLSGISWQAPYELKGHINWVMKELTALVPDRTCPRCNGKGIIEKP